MDAVRGIGQPPRQIILPRQTAVIRERDVGQVTLIVVIYGGRVTQRVKNSRQRTAPAPTVRRHGVVGVGDQRAVIQPVIIIPRPVVEPVLGGHHIQPGINVGNGRPIRKHHPGEPVQPVKSFGHRHPPVIRDARRLPGLIIVEGERPPLRGERDARQHVRLQKGRILPGIPVIIKRRLLAAGPLNPGEIMRPLVPTQTRHLVQGVGQGHNLVAAVIRGRSPLPGRIADPRQVHPIGVVSVPISQHAHRTVGQRKAGFMVGYQAVLIGKWANGIKMIGGELAGAVGQHARDATDLRAGPQQLR